MIEVPRFTRLISAWMMTAATALDALIARRSMKFVRAPGPADADLSRILQAGMSAPDHGGLKVWRYVLIRGPAIARLADLAIGAAKREGDARMTPEKEKNTRAWLADVPLLLALAHRIHHDHKIPEQEQLLSAGASVMNMLNAAHMLGYGAFWSTGLGTYLPAVQEALGLDPLDYRFMGFLAIGAPGAPWSSAPRPDWREFVSEWAGC
jgi:nitroreductase